MTDTGTTDVDTGTGGQENTDGDARTPGCSASASGDADRRTAA
jgi:hypothetical protein